MMGWDWNQMMPWHWGSGWGGMMLGGLGMMALWVLLIVLVVWGLRALVGGVDRMATSGGPPGDTPPTPLEIAQARYARGEIDRDEYEAIRQTLQGNA